MNYLPIAELRTVWQTDWCTKFIPPLQTPPSVKPDWQSQYTSCVNCSNCVSICVWTVPPAHRPQYPDSLMLTLHWKIMRRHGMKIQLFWQIIVADPGFSGGGCVNLLFGKVFAENCMEMKYIGLRGECASLVPSFGSANGLWELPLWLHSVLWLHFVSTFYEAAADPEFPRGGERLPNRERSQPIFRQMFCWKWKKLDRGHVSLASP